MGLELFGWAGLDLDFGLCFSFVFMALHFAAMVIDHSKFCLWLVVNV